MMSQDKETTNVVPENKAGIYTIGSLVTNEEDKIISGEPVPQKDSPMVSFYDDPKEVLKDGYVEIALIPNEKEVDKPEEGRSEI